MNAPKIGAQSASSKEVRPNLKINKERKARITMGIKQAANWIHDGLGKITLGIVVRGATLGILLAIGTGIYLATDSDITSEATSTTPKNIDTEYRFMDLEDEPLSVEFLRTYVYPEEAGQVEAPAKNIDTEYRFMDLEDEPLSVEFLRTYVYTEEQPSRSPAAQTDHQQEIERLEGEISAMLAEARQDPLTDPLELDRELRQLHHQIDLLKLEQ